LFDAAGEWDAAAKATFWDKTHAANENQKEKIVQGVMHVLASRAFAASPGRNGTECSPPVSENPSLSTPP
jgi:hypothetical protein